MELVEELTRRLRLRGRDNGSSAASSAVCVAHLRALLAKLTLRLKQFRKQVRPNYFNEFWLDLHAIAGRRSAGASGAKRKTWYTENDLRDRRHNGDKRKRKMSKLKCQLSSLMNLTSAL